MNRIALVSLALALGAALTVVSGCGPKPESGAAAAAAPTPPKVAGEATAERSDWVESIEDGMALASSSGKMMLVDFGAEW